MADETKTTSTETLRFHYIKNNSFRVYAADGFWGGTTPHGHLQINGYTERLPIPKSTLHQLKEVGGRRELGDEVEEERDQKDGIVREIHFGVIISLPAARSLAAFLIDQIAQVERAKEAEK